MSDAMDPRHMDPQGYYKRERDKELKHLKSATAMTPDEIEAAAKRVYDVMPTMGEFRIHRVGEPDPRFMYKTLRGPIPWESVDEDYRNYCRRIAAAALNVEETRNG